MKKSCLVLFACFVSVALSGCAYLAQGTQSDRPEWVTDQTLQAVAKMGVNPKTDLESKTATRWRYRAKHKVQAGSYICPAGSAVDISQDNILIIAPKAAHCTGPDKTKLDFVRLSRDGSVEPLVVE